MVIQVREVIALKISTLERFRVHVKPQSTSLTAGNFIYTIRVPIQAIGLYNAHLMKCYNTPGETLKPSIMELGIMDCPINMTYETYKILGNL